MNPDESRRSHPEPSEDRETEVVRVTDAEILQTFIDIANGETAALDPMRQEFAGRERRSLEWKFDDLREAIRADPQVPTDLQVTDSDLLDGVLRAKRRDHLKQIEKSKGWAPEARKAAMDYIQERIDRIDSEMGKGPDAVIAQRAERAVQSQVRRVREILRDAVDAPQLLTQRLREVKSFGPVRKEPVPIYEGDRVRIEWKARYWGLESDEEDRSGHQIWRYRNYLTLLLAADEGGLRSSLGYCHYRRCGRFFIVPDEPGKPGEKRRKYCPVTDPNDDHQKNEHNAASAERKKAAKSRRKAGLPPLRARRY